MVADPGAAPGTDRLRPLNGPRPVAVELAADGRPGAIVDRGRRLAVAAVRDRWLVEDEWWREPLGRRYLELLLVDGSVRTLYLDTFTDRWYAQAY